VTSPADELRTAAQTLRTARFAGAMTSTPAVAALLRAREPLAALLGEHASFASLFDQLWRARCGDTPAESEYAAETRKALAVARALNGGQP
jgi:hypothetical protein